MRPKVEWPDGKKICATFTVAFEAFTRGGHFKKAKGLEVNLVSLSHANYGGNAGIWRIFEILERNKVRATVDVNGLAVQKWPDAVKAPHAAGNEIAGHGTTNDIQMTDLTPAEQRAEIRAVNRIVKEAIGEQPVGWVSPGGHHTRETLGILAEEGYIWCGDQCDDDLPYVVEVDGKHMVIVPKHWFFNDWRAWNGGASTGAMAFQAFRDGFDFVLEEALRGKPGRVDALVHAELGGRPYMAHAFEKMIRYVRQHDDLVWLPVGPLGIRVNTIAPGNAQARWKTAADNKSPLGRPTSAADVGKAVAFLLSEDASHITGSCLDVSGGTTLH